MENLLTADEVAPLAKLEIHAVYRYARERKIPSIRIGSKVRFPESALVRWIEEQLSGQNNEETEASAEAA